MGSGFWLCTAFRFWLSDDLTALAYPVTTTSTCGVSEEILLLALDEQYQFPHFSPLNSGSNLLRISCVRLALGSTSSTP
jgi:hypothetical protein